MREHIAVVLVRPRFPENIGMAARGMANMGLSRLILIEPERFEYEKAISLATDQGREILDNVEFAPDLESALAPFTAAFGTTARTGGFRREVITPDAAAEEVRAVTRRGGTTALVFGPEDTGLENVEVEQCTNLVNIPTACGHSSLNLAQAVLLMAYECAKADRALPLAPEDARLWTRPAKNTESRRTTLEEERILFAALEDTLITIGQVPESNSSWFMQPFRRFLRRSKLRRHEFDMLMGICRQVKRLAR